MRGQMLHADGWMLMAHGYAWGVVTDQGGPRGDDEAFITSMAMLMADRDLSPRVHLQLKTMASLDPLMGGARLSQSVRDRRSRERPPAR